MRGTEKQIQWASEISETVTSILRAALPGSIWLTDEVDDDGTPIADCDMDIVSDENNDLPRLFLAADLDPDELVAHVYTLDDGTKVIAPAMWA